MQLHYVNYLLQGSISEFSCMALLLNMYSIWYFGRFKKGVLLCVLLY